MKLLSDQNINAVLCLSDGSCFFGKGVGNFGKTVGEICFNTSITGYQEIITDPSYAGQIINFTFPHIGNVGCNMQDDESRKVSAKGLILREDITQDSNYRSVEQFNSWLKKNNLTGICGVDTRALTRNIREKGARNAIIAFYPEGEKIDTKGLIDEIKDLPNLKGAELASQVSTQNSYDWDEKSFEFGQIVYKKLTDKKYKIVVVDYGVKINILRCLADYGFDVHVVPAQSSYEKIQSYNPDGIFLSNGPGDPLATSAYAVPVIKELLENNVPIFGICMGHQLLSIAAGLKTQKMEQGHRGANHPVKNLLNGQVEITSQNHGFCVTKDNIPDNVQITHISLFDNTIEGIRLKDKAAFSVQYHPESSPGPNDSKYLFENFVELIALNSKRNQDSPVVNLQS